MRFPPLLTRGSVLAPNLRRGEPAPLPSLAPERCERGRKGLPLPPARPCHHRRERAGGPHLGFSRVLLPVSAQSLGLSLRWSRSPALVVLPRTQVESPSRAPRLELSPVLSTGTYLHVLPPTALCLVPLPRQLASTPLRPPGPPHVTTARPSPLRPPPLSPAPWTAIRASPPPRRLMTPPPCLPSDRCPPSGRPPPSRSRAPAAARLSRRASRWTRVRFPTGRSASSSDAVACLCRRAGVAASATTSTGAQTARTLSAKRPRAERAAGPS